MTQTKNTFLSTLLADRSVLGGVFFPFSDGTAKFKATFSAAKTKTFFDLSAQSQGSLLCFSVLQVPLALFNPSMLKLYKHVPFPNHSPSISPGERKEQKKKRKKGINQWLLLLLLSHVKPLPFL